MTKPEGRGPNLAENQMGKTKRDPAWLSAEGCTIRFENKPKNHGYLDCTNVLPFVLSGYPWSAFPQSVSCSLGRTKTGAGLKAWCPPAGVAAVRAGGRGSG